jgi:beta-lactam-binding protein with PASTA domain
MPITTQVVYQRDADIPEGEVISQDPPDDTIIDPTSDLVVTIYVSTGPPVPGKVRFTFSQPYAVVTFG